MTAKPISTSTFVKAPPKDVYAAFMDPDVLVAWLPPAISGDPGFVASVLGRGARGRRLFHRYVR